MSILSNTTRAKGQRERCPTHPGRVIASAIEALGQTVNQVALAIGMSRSGLGLVVNEKRPVTPDTALRVATYFGTGVGGAKLLLGLQTDFDLWQAQAALRGALKEIIPATLPRAPQPSALKALRQGVRDQSGRHQST